MAAERDLERRVAGALHDWLDAEPAPHPQWDDAPARSRRPKAGGIPAPVRLFAAAALVVGAAGGALWAGGMLRGDEVPVTARVMCADVEDYPAPGTTAPRPVVAPWPEIGPDAAPSTGILQPGEVAVVARAGAPSALVRVSDPRICERYPTYRPRTPGTRFAVARVEVKALTDGGLAPWVGGDDHLAVRAASDPIPSGVIETVAGIPGTWRESSLETPAGFEWAGDVVFLINDGPADDLFVDFHAEGVQLEEPGLVSWAIGRRPGAEPPFDEAECWPRCGTAESPGYFRGPDGPITTGRIAADEWAIVEIEGRPSGIRVGMVDQVDRYPGATPERGAFVEALVEYDWRHRQTEDGDPVADPGFGPGEWRAVDGAGEPLDILDVPSGLRTDVPSGPRTSVLNPLLTDEDVQGGAWLAIDAPPDGEVVLEYRRDGEGSVLFEVLLRAAPGAPASVPPASPDPTPAPTPSPEAFLTDSELCATVEDYGVPGEPMPKPTLDPMPSIGPDATPSTGVLQPGEVAVLGDANGPGARLRIGDVRICDRYPTARPIWSGMRYVVVRMELLVDRSGYFPYWVGGPDRLWLRREDDEFPHDRSEPAYGVPGVSRSSSLLVRAGFEAVTDLVYAVPAAEGTRLFLDYRPAGDEDLQTPVTLSWDLGLLPGSAVGEPLGPSIAVPDGPATTGRIAADEVAVVEQAGIRFAVRAGRVDEVERYPGLDPERGRFVEVLVGYGAEPGGDIPGAGLAEWRAVTGAGEELQIRRLRDSDIEQVILAPHLTGSGLGWILIDAPPDGAVILQYRRGGEGPVLFEVLVREG